MDESNEDAEEISGSLTARYSEVERGASVGSTPQAPVVHAWIGSKSGLIHDESHAPRSTAGSAFFGFVLLLPDVDSSPCIDDVNDIPAGRGGMLKRTLGFVSSAATEYFPVPSDVFSIEGIRVDRVDEVWD